jgi:hypothetical protein
MTPDTITSFLTYYLRSLRERTRDEAKGAQYGLDWVVYNLGLALTWKPVRLPWLRGGANELSKTKTESEFGIDLSFLRDDDETLVIFVLKDEVLSYKNWIAESFESDLRRAAAPNLTTGGVENVKRVVIILAYNKDDHQDGITSYELTVKALGTKVGDLVSLEFERWNLSQLTEQVRNHLLTPSLVPQSFYGQFTYLCAQLEDFVHGSDEWVNQLIPNWRRFLNNLVQDPLDERLLRLVPVTLVILRGYGGDKKSSATGWLDLAEWAMLTLWEAVRKTPGKTSPAVAADAWKSLYVDELERFYSANAELVGIEHSLGVRRGTTNLDPLANAFVAFWHSGRLGLLSMALREELDRQDADKRQECEARIDSTDTTLLSLLNANPAAVRPVLDIQHIELFLTWRALWLSGRRGEIAQWLSTSQQRLLMRRLGQTTVPFILGVNSWELAFERAAGDPTARYFGDHTSYLLLMVLEFCCGLPDEERAPLLREYYLRIIRGVENDGSPIQKLAGIDLICWAQPTDWEASVLRETIQDGDCITVEFDADLEQENLGLVPQIRQLVDAHRATYLMNTGAVIPLSAFVLACLKHQSPLPPEMWRALLFPVAQTPQAPFSDE